MVTRRAACGGAAAVRAPFPAPVDRPGTLPIVLHVTTARLPWDDLDAETCQEDGTPDWRTLIVVGPIRRRDVHGNTTIEWKVTVHCGPPR